MERLSAALLLAFGAVICAISLFLPPAVICAISLFLPPQGEIDSSVLMLFGRILVYAGSIFGVKVYIANLLNRRK